MKKVIFSLFLIVFSLSSCTQNSKDQHLFILSGQSNMELLRPEESFIPVLQKKYGKKNVVVAKYAKGTQPIRRWYKNWKPKEGDEPKAEPYLYDSLMIKVKKVIKNKKFASLTFLWMQGERDARKSHGEVYEDSLLGLYHQLSGDLGVTNMNFVIGRLSDCGLVKKGWPHWKMMREIQVKVAESNSRFGWINTDDLNDGINRQGRTIKNGIHMTKDGYVEMGKRFAEKTITLIELNK